MRWRALISGSEIRLEVLGTKTQSSEATLKSQQINVFRACLAQAHVKPESLHFVLECRQWLEDR